MQFGRNVMKRKKTLSGFILALSLTLVSNSLTSVASSSAEVVTWDYTYEINMNIEFDNEGAHCYVEIVGFPCVSEIDNITVTLVEMVGKQKKLVKKWSGLSTSGNLFELWGDASNVSSGHTYRLTTTADVHCNGVIESISSNKDIIY